MIQKIVRIPIIALVLKSFFLGINLIMEEEFSLSPDKTSYPGVNRILPV
jgi:hypothetical protein